MPPANGQKTANAGASRSAEPVALRAADGFQLACDLHLPPDGTGPRAAVLLAPAMGVERGFYRHFAGYLAGRGAAVLAVDYRGVGGSRPAGLRGFGARLRDWAELDLEAALAHLSARFAGLPLRWVGHSVGGQLLGLLRDPPVERALLLCSQSGYWRHWSGAGRLGMAVLWYAGVPILTGALGYLPLRGSGVPAGVAREWARWGRDPAYVLSYARGRPCAFHAWSGMLRAYAFDDDGYAPPAAVEALVRGYVSARREVRVVSPRDVGASRIGHFGPLRPAFRDSLWTEMADWLLAA